MAKITKFISSAKALFSGKIEKLPELGYLCKKLPFSLGCILQKP